MRPADSLAARAESPASDLPRDPLPRRSAFRPALVGEGLRGDGRTASERALLSRLELTGFLRRVGTLHDCRAALGDGAAYWFVNEAFGLKLGVTEAVVLRGESRPDLDWARLVAASSGSGIVSLTCAAEGEMPAERDDRTVEIGGLRATRLTRELREVLLLDAGYEPTLAGFGRHTRRNVRNARKMAAAEGIGFEFVAGGSPITDADRAALAKVTEPHALRAVRVRGLEAYAEQTGQPFRAALRSADGKVISYSCGFFARDAAYLIYQLNDRDWSRVGPSLMLRAFLLEALIERGVRELVFIHGCSGILRHACVPMVADHYWVTRHAAARLGTAALARFWPHSTLGRAAGAVVKVADPGSEPG